MGTQQSNQKSVIPSQIILPQPGYRITNLEPSINAKGFKLNIMTDYVIGNDPRFLDLKKTLQLNQTHVQFQVLSILDYRIRKVLIPIQTNSVQSNNQTHNSKQQVQIFVQEEKGQSYTLNAIKQFSLGINFKLYPKINDTILRISKVFKNSPLQKAQIKKDEYVVGMIQGDFTSMKSFVDLVKLLIHSQFQYITLAICDAEGVTRLQKIAVVELQKWKENYGIGYLGVQLAQGWLNKWQLKKNLDANKKKQLNSSIKVGDHKKKSISEEMTQFTQASFTKQSLNKVQATLSVKNEPKIEQMREEVDFSIQNSIVSPEKGENQSGFIEPKQIKHENEVLNRINEQNLQLQIKSRQNLEDHKQQKQKQVGQFSKESSNLQQDSNSQISSNQIEQKCSELQQGSYEGKKREVNVVKKSKNIVEINFKDDASTICMCKDYSKHCEKCFKEKQGNFLFFNKKTNRIILIDKAMLFPKKN